MQSKPVLRYEANFKTYFTSIEISERVSVSNEDLIKYGEEVGGVHGNVLHKLTKLLYYFPYTKNTLNAVRKGLIKLSSRINIAHIEYTLFGASHLDCSLVWC